MMIHSGWIRGSATDPGRSVQAFAKANKLDPNALDTQLQFIAYELNTFPKYGKAELLQAKDTLSAAQVFASNYESCGKCAQKTRDGYATQIATDCGNGANNGKDAPSKSSTTALANDKKNPCIGDGGASGSTSTKSLRDLGIVVLPVADPGSSDGDGLVTDPNTGACSCGQQQDADAGADASDDASTDDASDDASSDDASSDDASSDDASSDDAGSYYGDGGGSDGGSYYGDATMSGDSGYYQGSDSGYSPVDDSGYYQSGSGSTSGSGYYQSGSGSTNGSGYYQSNSGGTNGSGYHQSSAGAANSSTGYYATGSGLAAVRGRSRGRGGAR